MTLTIGLVVYFGLYILIDIGRLLKRRLQTIYLRRAFLVTLIWLIILICLTLLLGWAFSHHSSAFLYMLEVGQLICSLAILGFTKHNIRSIKPPTMGSVTSQSLPTLSVCIPARNETDELRDCLTALVASDYPKLEILVLDDSSQNRHTPEIIRSFAQNGVRFLAGKEPPTRWLAKNYAYQQLAEVANGELLLFCGVDTRFQPQTLSSLVKLLLQKNKSMISTVPLNQLPNRSGISSLLVQPARYAWELALPRRLIQRPPVLSTCWLIKRGELESAGGFAAVSHKTVPESYFARYSISQGDGYSFSQADESINLVSMKSFEEQLSTAIRTRYPQLHRRPEITALVSLAELYVLVAPYAMLIAALLTGWWYLAIISAASCVLLSWHYYLIAQLTYGRSIPLSWVILPIVGVYDVCLLNYSMYKYEFSRVFWKDRDISLPVMLGRQVLQKKK